MDGREVHRSRREEEFWNIVGGFTKSEMVSGQEDRTAAVETVNVVEPYARMLPLPGWEVDPNLGFTQTMGLALLRHIEWCARISHRSEEAQTGDSWKKIIQHVVLDHGDWSVVEHATVSVDAYVDRGITHEWVRHRLFSYTQESTRFVNYKKKMPPSFIYPMRIEDRQMVTDSERTWHEAIDACERAYRRLLELGHSPQIARSVFPNALASRLIVTGNLRNWRHFFIMRTTQEAHPQMKQVTIPLLQEFRSKIPLLFDDLEPNMKQSLAMSKVR
jgi:thymidylate synthase (FAD)